MPFGQRLLNSVMDVLFPPCCPVCEKNLPIQRVASALCDDCQPQVPVSDCYCQRCSAPVGPHLTTRDGCRKCRRDRFAFAGVLSAGEYRGIVQLAVLRAKRAGGEPAAAWLADWLWERRGSELTSLPIDLIVPVPQHWRRRVLSSHNTAELIARRLASRLKGRVDASILRKVRYTRAQASLPPSGRRMNLRDAFVASRMKPGCKVLLVDDVLTTGATAHRAARALIDARAESVWVAAPARGVGR